MSHNRMHGRSRSQLASINKGNAKRFCELKRVVAPTSQLLSLFLPSPCKTRVYPRALPIPSNSTRRREACTKDFYKQVTSSIVLELISKVRKCSTEKKSLPSHRRMSCGLSSVIKSSKLCLPLCVDVNHV